MISISVCARAAGGSGPAPLMAAAAAAGDKPFISQQDVDACRQSVYNWPGGLDVAALSGGAAAASGGGSDEGNGGAHPPRRPSGLRPAPNFSLPVDVEYKAERLALLSLQRPHMRAFHLSWLTFFSAFVSTFAPAALLPVLRDDLNLTATDIGNAGVASVCGAIASRVLMGTLVDLLGPRLGAAMGLLLTAPATFCMALVSDAAGFIAARAIIGLSLSLFVVDQVSGRRPGGGTVSCTQRMAVAVWRALAHSRRRERAWVCGRSVAHSPPRVCRRVCLTAAPPPSPPPCPHARRRG